jgi:hypothetical protein
MMIPEERDPLASSELEGAFYRAIEEVNDTIVRVSNGGIRNVSFFVPTCFPIIQDSTEMTPIRELIQEFTPFLASLENATEVHHLGTFTVAETDPNTNSVESGRWETASSLREEEDANDTMGTESDPGAMGYAETWFRKCLEEKIGDQS